MEPSASKVDISKSILFKGFSFAKKINSLKYADGVEPALSLVGIDVPDVLAGDMCGKKLLLLINGLSAADKGEHKELFYKELKEHSFDKQTSTITFDESKLQVNVQDLESTSDPIALGNITDIFSTTKPVFCLYSDISGDRELEKLESIPRGIRDMEGDEAIENVCSVTLHRREQDSTTIRSFKDPNYREQLDMTVTLSPSTGVMEIREWGWRSGDASRES